MTGDERDHKAAHREISRVRGYYQGYALRALMWITAVLAVLALALPGRTGDTAGVGAVAVVVATPLLRIGWLCLRWAQERDWRFVVLGCALLAVVGGGWLLA